MNLNDTNLTASTVSFHDDDDSITGLDVLALASTEEEVVTPEVVSSNITVERTQNTEEIMSDPVIAPDTDADSGESSACGATADLEAKLQRAFDGLLGAESSGSFEEMTRKERVIVTVEKLLQLFSGPCDAKDCNRSKEVWHKWQGGVMVIGWNCGGGHGDIWESSDVLIKKEKGPSVYVNTVVLAASILLTGNNFSKVAMLTKCLNLGFISSATFDRIQRLYAIPTVQEFWSDMKKVIHEVMKDEKVVLSGDGRNDSPGFSAQYCVYSLMEAMTKVVVDLEVKDKRETGGTSTTMEVAALKVLLERLIETMQIGEITTDASTSVMAMVKKLKGMSFYYIGFNLYMY